MTQQRLLDDPGTSALARTLLASSADDGPGDGSRSSVAKRLGIGAAILASGTHAGAVATILKIGLVLLALGGITVAVVVVSNLESAAGEPRPVVAPSRTPAVGETAAPTAPTTIETPASIEVAAVIETSAPTETPATSATRPSTTTAPTRPSTATTSTAPRPAPRVAHTKVPEAPPVAPPVEPPVVSPPFEPAPLVEPPVVEPPAPVTIDPRLLAAEVAVLDRARVALKAGNVAAALTALDEHDRDFATGSLRAEADVVRIETLIKKPDHTAARERANAFIATYPRSPLVKRVRSLIDRLPAKTQEAP